MILEDFYLRSRAKKVWLESGIDSLEHARDPDYFKSYPYDVSYKYNSRGYRDKEWPDDIDHLRNLIWCIGDSFTVGLGCPIDLTWPAKLESVTGTRTINVSLDGASNMWIARKAIRVLTEIQPKNLIITWSYLHRRELEKETNDELRRIFGRAEDSDQDNLVNLADCVGRVLEANISTRIIQSIIPHASKFGALSHAMLEDSICHIDKTWHNIKGSNWPDRCPLTVSKFIELDLSDELEQHGVYKDLLDKIFLVENLKKILVSGSLGEITQLDYARDQHHFGPLTNQQFVDQIVQLLV